MKVYGELVRAQLEILQSDPAAGVEGRIWFNDVSNAFKVDLDGTNIATIYNSYQNLVPTNTANDLGSSAGNRFRNIYLSNQAFLGNATSNSVAVSTVSNTLSGTTQIGYYAVFTGTSTSTVGLKGYVADVINACTAADVVVAYDGGITANSSSVITRAIIFDAFRGFTASGTITNRAVLADSHGFVGNYFLHQASADANVLGGALTVAGATLLSSTLTVTSSVTFSSLTASTVPYVNSAKTFTSSAVTPTELGYLSGATSNIQTQISAISAATVVSKSDTAATYTILDNDQFGTFLLTTGASDRTITLPTAADNTNRKIVFKKVDSGAGDVIIDGEGAETIDGAATLTIANQNDFAELQCNGSSWRVIGYGPNLAFNARLRPTSTTADLGGFGISASCGDALTTGSVFTDVSNLSVTLTTSGKPVRIYLVPDASGNLSTIHTSSGSSQAHADFKILRDSTEVGRHRLYGGFGGATSASLYQPVGSVNAVDVVSAGTFTYKLQFQNGSSAGTSNQTRVQYAKLVAEES